MLPGHRGDVEKTHQACSVLGGKLRHGGRGLHTTLSERPPLGLVTVLPKPACNGLHLFYSVPQWRRCPHRHRRWLYSACPLCTSPSVLVPTVPMSQVVTVIIETCQSATQDWERPGSMLQHTCENKVALKNRGLRSDKPVFLHVSPS